MEETDCIGGCAVGLVVQGTKRAGRVHARLFLVVAASDNDLGPSSVPVRPRRWSRLGVAAGFLSLRARIGSLCGRTATEEERRGYRSSVRRVMTTTAPVELTARRRRLTVTGRPRERASLCRLFLPSSSSPLCHFLRHSSPPLLLLPLLLSLFFFAVYPSRCHSRLAAATAAANGDAGICQRQKKTEIGRKEGRREGTEKRRERTKG